MGYCRYTCQLPMEEEMTRSQRRFKTKYRTKCKRIHHPNEAWMSRHHRQPKSVGGGNEPANISIVPKHLHDHWHAMFGNKHPKQIVQIINQVWLDPRFMFVCVERQVKTIEASLANHPQGN